ncbi:MAG: hypothetical protein ACJASV_001257 [Pseudorhodobacter sp.]|jgi:hypothetical protein
MKRLLSSLTTQERLIVLTGIAIVLALEIAKPSDEVGMPPSPPGLLRTPIHLGAEGGVRLPVWLL